MKFPGAALEYGGAISPASTGIGLEKSGL